MTESLVVLLAGFLVIAASTVAGRRLGIAAPLVLVAIGVAASFLPVFDSTQIEPELILEGVLPPLLYSSAVSMPSMNFRREFGAISGLSVLLVVASALLLGLFFVLVLPDLGFAWGVALGAIVSPTDAVATSIIKQMSVSRRVVAILDGESLLNDATALVLLRTAILAAGASFSLFGVAGRFVYSVGVALVIGWLVGWLNLVVRKRVTDSTVNTVISFAVPFAASVPATLLGASGLVAAVIAGLVTGILAPRDLSPQNRLSDTQNWRTVELLLEGAVFLTMGVQIKSIVTNVEDHHEGAGNAVLVAAGAVLLTILVRAVYVALLLYALRARLRSVARMQTRLRGMQEQLSSPEGREEAFSEVNRGRRPASARQLDWFAIRIRRAIADFDYFMREPLGGRDGTGVVWAGMRGAVTVAAAQTLPEDTPLRSTLVLIAFAVAAMSLLGQGGTIGPLLRRISSPADGSKNEEATDAQWLRIVQLMRTEAQSVPSPELPRKLPRKEHFDLAKQHRLDVLAAQRSVLLDARDHGDFDAELLAEILATLDADQIALEMRGRSPD